MVQQELCWDGREVLSFGGVLGTSLQLDVLRSFTLEENRRGFLA